MPPRRSKRKAGTDAAAASTGTSDVNSSTVTTPASVTKKPKSKKLAAATAAAATNGSGDAKSVATTTAAGGEDDFVFDPSDIWKGVNGADSELAKRIKAATAAAPAPAADALRVGIITCSRFPNGFIDDQLLLTAKPALALVPYVWDADSAKPNALAAAADSKSGDSSRADIFVIRSTWDYFDKTDAFIAWLKACESIPSVARRFFNPIPLVLWNLNKHTYLPQLASAGGVPIAGSVWFPAPKPGDEKAAAAETVDLAKLLAAEKWSRAIVKPIVSGGSHDTWCTHDPKRDDQSAAERAAAAAADQTRFAAQLLASRTPAHPSHGLVVQRFIPEVTLAGEYSLTFFNGTYSHATVKRPQNVNKPNGLETDTAVAPNPVPSHIRKFAERVLAITPAAANDKSVDPVLRRPLNETTLYARVDCVESASAPGGMILMELELIEPLLRLAATRAAPQLFADAIRKRVAAAL